VKCASSADSRGEARHRHSSLYQSVVLRYRRQVFSRLVERAAEAADLGIKAHAHMLRHACGYKLANDGHDTRAIQAYLGHRNIQNTTRYTALAPARFKEFFRD
jgi:site-specific recombinase XerD